MKKMFLNISGRGKVYCIPNRNSFVGRREPVKIQLVAPSVVESNRIKFASPTPVSFCSKSDESLKSKMEYVQEELLKIQRERKEEEFSHYVFHSGIPDEELIPYFQLGNELYRDKEVDLGESAIPFEKQQKDLGSLNERHPRLNKHPHDTERLIVRDKNKPGMKSAYSRWSE